MNRATVTTGSSAPAVLGEFRVEPQTATTLVQIFAVLDEHGAIAAEFESDLDAAAFASRRNAELMRARSNGAALPPSPAPMEGRNDEQV